MKKLIAEIATVVALIMAGYTGFEPSREVELVLWIAVVAHSLRYCEE